MFNWIKNLFHRKDQMDMDMEAKLKDTSPNGMKRSMMQGVLASNSLKKIAQELSEVSDQILEDSGVIPPTIPLECKIGDILEVGKVYQAVIERDSCNNVSVVVKRKRERL